RSGATVEAVESVMVAAPGATVGVRLDVHHGPVEHGEVVAAAAKAESHTGRSVVVGDAILVRDRETAANADTELPTVIDLEPLQDETAYRLVAAVVVGEDEYPVLAAVREADSVGRILPTNPYPVADVVVRVLPDLQAALVLRADGHGGAVDGDGAAAPRGGETCTIANLDRARRRSAAPEAACLATGAFTSALAGSDDYPSPPGGRMRGATLDPDRGPRGNSVGLCEGTPAGTHPARVVGCACTRKATPWPVRPTLHLRGARAGIATAAGAAGTGRAHRRAEVDVVVGRSGDSCKTCQEEDEREEHLAAARNLLEAPSFPDPHPSPEGRTQHPHRGGSSTKSHANGHAWDPGEPTDMHVAKQHEDGVRVSRWTL